MSSPPTALAERESQRGEAEKGPAARPLPAPRSLAARLPLSRVAAERTWRTRGELADVLHGRDTRRLVVIVGPCSLHDRQSALEYAGRLRRAADRFEDELVVVMRSYLEKPRSLGGWKGFVNDPDLDGSCDLAKGLALGREMLLAIGAEGVACASELLDPMLARYLEDLLSWAAIGARTVASQPHRELASGMPMPVGFKNGLDGDVRVALDAAESARRPHDFAGLDERGRAAWLHTEGNPDTHVVLRGGGGVANHDAESVAWAIARSRPRARSVIVDCSHGNSGKDHRRQARVCRELLELVGSGRGAGIGGILLESHLRAGRQEPRPGHPPRGDQSLTDACIDWVQTETLLKEAASAVKSNS